MYRSARRTLPQVSGRAVHGLRFVRRISTILLMCALASVSNPPKAFGRVLATQTFRGTILGTVTDVNGAAIPEAAVTAKNFATGLERATVTDSAGNYAIPELPVGIYEVTVTKTNFAMAKVTGAKVEIAGERRADVILQVTGGSESVDIRANAVQVESTTNTLGGTSLHARLRTFRSTGATIRSSWCWFRARPEIPRVRPTRPARSVCSAPTEIADVPTTTCSTAPI